MGSCENLGRVYCDKPELLIPSVPECCSLRATGLRAKKTEMSADSTGRYYVCSSFSLTYRFSWATLRTAHRSKDRVNFIVGSHSENWFNIFDQRDIAGNLSRLQLNDIRTQTLNFSASGGTGCALRLTNTATLTPHKYEDEDHFAVFSSFIRKNYAAVFSSPRPFPQRLPEFFLTTLVRPVVPSFPLYYHGQCSLQPTACTPPLRRARTTKLSTHSHAFSAQLPNARLTAVFIFHPLYLKMKKLASPSFVSLFNILQNIQHYPD